MAVRHFKSDAGFPAVGYLRRSTGKQEKSLDDQRREIERYAADHGYKIHRWYVDDGISGDTTEKRTDFLRMHADACQRRDFQVILVWDQDRFGRFNSLEAGYWVHPLVQAGVQLVTVTEGLINWNSFTGRVVYGLKQEGKHQFLHDLSRNTARGQISNALNGYSCGQAAPYGMDRMLVDEAGRQRQRIRNGEQYAKPRSWHVTFVPSDDPVKVETAQWLFCTYADQDVGLRLLAEDLNGRGIRGPRGGPWHLGTIREILKNEKYVGDFVWPKRRMGKYHRVLGTEIHERDVQERRPGCDAQVRSNAPEEQNRKADAHPGLVSREVFQQVQEKLLAWKKRTTPCKKKNGDRYVLTGLLHCGHCEAKMYGANRTRRKNGKTYEQQKYICSTYLTKGKTECYYHTVDQERITRVLVGKLRDTVLAGERLDDLRQRIRQILEEQQSVSSDQHRLDELRSRKKSLDRAIQQGAGRILAAPQELVDELTRELLRLKHQRTGLADQIASLERQSESMTDIDSLADQATARFWTLADEIDQAPPFRVRELVGQMVQRIDLHFDHVQKRTRIECPFSHGIITLRPDPLLYRLVNRGDRTRLELFRRGVVELQTSQPNVCGHVVAVLA